MAMLLVYLKTEGFQTFLQGNPVASHGELSIKKIHRHLFHQNSSGVYKIKELLT